MKLTIVIVNYNVKSYLHQCLHSVERAIRGMNAEVVVVDNASTDASVEELSVLFHSPVLSHLLSLQIVSTSSTLL